MENNDLQNFIDELKQLSDKYAKIQTENDMQVMSDKMFEDNQLLLDGLVRLDMLIEDIENKKGVSECVSIRVGLIPLSLISPLSSSSFSLIPT